MEESNNNLCRKPNPNLIPNASTVSSDPHQRPISARAASKTVIHKGVWVKKSKQYEKKNKEKVKERIRYATELSYTSITKQRKKIWLGTYDTPEEGALAYDIASIKFKGVAPNQTIGYNGEMKVAMTRKKEESVKSEVESKIREHFAKQARKEATDEGKGKFLATRSEV